MLQTNVFQLQWPSGHSSRTERKDSSDSRSANLSTIHQQKKSEDYIFLPPEDDNEFDRSMDDIEKEADSLLTYSLIH